MCFYGFTITSFVFFQLLGSIGCIYLCVLLSRRPYFTKEVTVNGTVTYQYIESSADNLNLLSDETELRHRRPNQVAKRHRLKQESL